MLRTLWLFALLSVPAGAQDLVFSLDLGSDSAQDPGLDPNERGFDPGDVYNSTVPMPVPPSGADGDVWDDCLLGGFPCTSPGPGPSASPTYMELFWSTGGCGGNSCFGQFLDVDAIQYTETDVSSILSSALNGTALPGPLPLASFSALAEAELRAALVHIGSTGAGDGLLYVSFDDDAARGWSGSVAGGPGDSIPRDSATSPGRLYGSASERSEVLVVPIDVSAGGATTTGAMGFRSETELHPDLAPNPTISQKWFDDDVDALGWGKPGIFPFMLFSADQEATLGFEWGDIYGTTPTVSKRISVTGNLGLPFGTDVDAFELVLIDHPIGFEALALLFSVDDDDDLTPFDESGGLSPGAIYLSYMDGASSVFLPGVPHTVEVLYGIQDLDGLPGFETELFRIDPATGEEASLGFVLYDSGVPPYGAGSLAADASGVLYTIHDSKLVRVDPDDPSASSSVLDLTPPLPLGTSEGMDFDPDGTLWFLGGSGKELYSLPDVGSGAYISHGPVTSSFFEGLAFDDATGLLVAVDLNSNLHTIDLASGAPIVTAFPTTSPMVDTRALTQSSDGELFGSEEFFRKFTLSAPGASSSYIDVGAFSAGVEHMHGMAFVELTVDADDVDALAVASVSGPVSYCTAGTSASGCMATLAASGSASATAASGFTVTASGVEGGKDGLMFFGTSGRQVNPWGSSSSYQCVRPPVTRGGLLSGSGIAGNCTGVLSQDLNALWSALPAKNPGSGALVQAQCWYRDPLNTSNQSTSLSDAIEFTVGP